MGRPSVARDPRGGAAESSVRARANIECVGVANHAQFATELAKGARIAAGSLPAALIIRGAQLYARDPH